MRCLPATDLIVEGCSGEKIIAPQAATWRVRESASVGSSPQGGISNLADDHSIKNHLSEVDRSDCHGLFAVDMGLRLGEVSCHPSSRLTVSPRLYRYIKRCIHRSSCSENNLCQTPACPKSYTMLFFQRFLYLAPLILIVGMRATADVQCDEDEGTELGKDHFLPWHF